MSYEQILDLLSQFSLFAWVASAVLSFVILLYTRNRGWILITIGSAFVVLRQAWKFAPGYELGQASDAVINAHMLRFVFGSIGALLLIAGFFGLVVSYYVLKTRLEQ